MSIRRIGGLETEQDIAFTERVWAVQRVGWGLMALILLAALLGLLGPGPLSRTTAAEAGVPIRVEYERFVRSNTPVDVKVHLEPGMMRGGEVRLGVDRDYLERMEVEKVVPEPDEVEIGPGRLTYVFEAAEGDAPALVTFYLRPKGAGRLTARIGPADGQPLRFWQFVYP